MHSPVFPRFASLFLVSCLTVFGGSGCDKKDPDAAQMLTKSGTKLDVAPADKATEAGQSTPAAETKPETVKIDIETNGMDVVANWPKVDLANLESHCKQQRSKRSNKALNKHDQATCACLRYETPRKVSLEDFRKDSDSVLSDPELVNGCEEQALPEMIALLGQLPCEKAFAALVDPPKYCSCVIGLANKPISPPRNETLKECLDGQAPEE